MLNVKINKNQELQNYIEERMQEITDLHKKAAEGDLLCKVNILFEEKKEDWIQQILLLLNSEEYVFQKELSDKMLILEKLCILSEKEQKSELTPLLYKFSSLNEMTEVYEKTGFYLRRIELGMEKEAGEKLTGLIRKWDFSPEYIIMVLEHTVIHNKYNTYIRVARILDENGYEHYNDQILKGAQLYVQK